MINIENYNNYCDNINYEGIIYVTYHNFDFSFDKNISLTFDSIALLKENMLDIGTVFATAVPKDLISNTSDHIDLFGYIYGDDHYSIYNNHIHGYFNKKGHFVLNNNFYFKKAYDKNLWQQHLQKRKEYIDLIKKITDEDNFAIDILEENLAKFILSNSDEQIAFKVLAYQNKMDKILDEEEKLLLPISELEKIRVNNFYKKLKKTS